MAQQDYSGIITIGALGALAWYAYEQGWFSSLLPAVAAPTGTPAAAINCPAPGVLVAGICTQPSSGNTGSSAPAGSTGSAAPVTTPPAPSTAPNSNQLGPILQLAGTALQAGAIPNIGGTLNADQWNFYWNQLGFTPNNNFGQTFFPAGRPANSSNYTQYTASQFLVAADAGGTGMSGFYGGIPAGAIHGGW